ncbi:hypothetical protein BD413DRAFT_477584, partial [Trametes elegans]
KALKVVDLKDILNKAAVAIPSKANKQDLIAKILAAPAAVDVYHQQHGGAPAQTASKPISKAQEKPQPPQTEPYVSPFLVPSIPLISVGSASAPAVSKPSTPVEPASTAERASTKPASQTAPKAVPTAAEAPEDEEAAKRKARAARFGIPVVEPKAAAPQKNGRAANGKASKGAAPAPDDAEKIAARAARFGLEASSAKGTQSNGQTNGRKRPAPPSEPVDEEELARRKKRAERFGIPLVVRTWMPCSMCSYTDCKYQCNRAPARETQGNGT